MSSHGGQPNFPFGYQQENIHGLGLPEFITPGPPPGQPLLNATENQNLDSFFNDFDQNAPAKHFSQFVPTGHDQYFGIPPLFVGSETDLGPQSMIAPNPLQSGGFQYGSDMLGHDLNNFRHTSIGHPGMHSHLYGDPSMQNPIPNHIQPVTSMQPAFGATWQQQDFHQPAMPNPQQPNRQPMAFGTDARFQPNGYAAPHNPSDPDLPNGMKIHPMDFFEPTSGSTTQPNTRPSTRPNTQPSSPNWQKKRTFDDFQQDQPNQTGLNLPTNGQQSITLTQPSSRKRGSMTKSDKAKSTQPPTPLSHHKSQTPVKSEGDDHEEDAEAEEEDEATPEQLSSSSPTRGRRRITAPPQSKAAQKKKASSNTTSSPTKPGPRVKMVARKIVSSRVPLTQEQRKANHTNSEQRRRDATARAYAELYDLVPELEDHGKQSTMKKLEVVVAKVLRVKQTVYELRMKLGLDIHTGRPKDLNDANAQ
ncbi:hypothetical protein PV08_00979 [Exophiala spinifera]|uniref:BHLH domain-containing protein n=1 Tax=Exophiala spinifera TaxID=91928 RepID=A0A0D2CA13_9EURO|nr:uncharacterized protein PV08_00979 [Exophiala spinifera]KIW20404.1 hypothetical protein PV08_00979 [Exophiala spinifera]